MRILGIETSCDETGLAIYDSEAGIVADVLYSQVELHAEFGGVVPELASRDHIRKITPLLRQLFSQSGLSAKDIDGVAFTAGPGLVGALMVGACYGRALAWAWDVPGIAVHHMEGHLLAPLMADDAPQFPFVALLVSGGHTQLVRVDGIGHYQLLGESLDDAAGEAFDKAAKMMDLPYPGGPNIAAIAEQGDPKRFKFPRPMVNRPGLEFSFSGLKTYTLNTVAACREERGGELTEQDKADIAQAFQQAVVDTLAIKCERALEQEQLDTLIMAGGVSANKKLRASLADRLAKRGAQVLYPPAALCTDNGAMIAYAGFRRLAAGQPGDDLPVAVKARWPMTDLPAVG